MEDQGKRLLIAVALSMAILFLWSWWTGRNAPPRQPPQPAQVEQAPAQPATQPAAAATAQPAAPVEVKPRGPEQTEVIETEKYKAVFSTHGGALTSFVLKDSQYYEEGPEGRQPMDLVRMGGEGVDSRFYPFQVTMPQSTFGVDPQGEWTLAKKSDTELEATWRSADLEVIKRYRVEPSTYAILMDVRVTNLSKQQAGQRLGVEVFGYQDPNAKEGGMFSYAPPVWAASCFVGGELHTDPLKDLRGAPRPRTGDVHWTGVGHKYFLLAAAPKPGQAEQEACTTSAVAERQGVLEATLVFPEWKLQPGDSAVKTVVLFAGPKKLDQLQAVDKLAGGETNLEAAVDWGPAPTSWFTFIARPMLALLRVFHGWVGNWGVAIILLTILVKLLTLYWTQKSMRSMKEMSKLKPKIDELRAKYPDDKQRQNMEMMNLYKQHKINPLGGCLPMLLQMPIWMALYSALNAAAELHQAPFVGWLNDLTAPDPYYVLPIVLTALMFLQSKLTPAAVDSAQQKMLMYMMPVMFGLFSLFFPSGLTLYILTNTVLSMGHQVYMNKTDTTAAQPAAAAAVAKAAAPKGGAPKGPAPGGGKRKQRPA